MRIEQTGGRRMSWRVVIDGQRQWPRGYGLSKEGASYFARQLREQLGEGPEGEA